MAVILLAFGGTSSAMPQDTDAIVAAARASVEAALGSRYASVELVETGRPVTDVPAGVALHALPVAGRFPRQRFTVDVQFLRGGRVVGKASVGFALRAGSEGWVYARDAHDHEGASALALEPRQVDAAAGAPVSPGDLTGLRLRHNVRAGQAVKLADFERVPDVDNRQPVKLRAAFGEIIVESMGLALRSGNRGDVVTVQVDGATAPVKATVIDHGVAELVR